MQHQTAFPGMSAPLPEPPSAAPLSFGAAVSSGALRAPRSAPAFSSRARLTISEPLSKPNADGDVIHSVTVKIGDQEYSARVAFRKIRRGAAATWGSFGDCSDEAFRVINNALERKGEKALAKML